MRTALDNQNGRTAHDRRLGDLGGESANLLPACPASCRISQTLDAPPWRATPRTSSSPWRRGDGTFSSGQPGAEACAEPYRRAADGLSRYVMSVVLGRRGPHFWNGVL